MNWRMDTRARNKLAYVWIQAMRTKTYLHTQAQTYACRNEHRRVFFDFFKFFSIKTQPKHVPTPPKVSGFHLNPSHNKTQAFTLCIYLENHPILSENPKLKQFDTITQKHVDYCH